MDILTMAIVGFGKSAMRYHLPYLLNRKNIHVKYIVDRSNKTELQANYQDSGIKFVTDIQEVLADDTVQLVTLCTPPLTHFSLGKQVLSANKNVLIEKPFCETSQQATELFEMAKEKNLVAMPYQNRRFDSDFRTTMQVIKKNYLGEPFLITSRMDKYRPDDKQQTGAPQEGALYGLGVHLIDQAVSVFGKPESATYDLQKLQNASSTIEDAFKITLNYQLMRYEVVVNPLIAKAYPRFVAQGKKGTFIKSTEDQQENDLKLQIFPGEFGFGEDQANEFGTVKYQNQNGDWIEKSLPTINGDYGLVYDSLEKTINHGMPKLVSDEEALTVLQILEAGISTTEPTVIKF